MGPINAHGVILSLGKINNHIYNYGSHLGFFYGKGPLQQAT